MPVVKKLVVKKPIVKKPLTEVRYSNPQKDKQIQALKPGKRLSKEGNIYYENRINRADKGKLYGTNDLMQNIKTFEIIADATANDIKKDINYCNNILKKYNNFDLSVFNKLHKANVNIKTKVFFDVTAGFIKEIVEHEKILNKLLKNFNTKI